jgi:hypothetical protein
MPAPDGFPSEGRWVSGVTVDGPAWIKAQSIVEYSEVHEGNRARTVVLAREDVYGREYRLVQSTAGYECAGSCARWTDGYTAVLFDSDGAVHGRRFKSEADARALFSRWIADRMASMAGQ